MVFVKENIFFLSIAAAKVYDMKCEYMKDKIYN